MINTFQTYMYSLIYWCFSKVTHLKIAKRVKMTSFTLPFSLLIEWKTKRMKYWKVLKTIKSKAFIFYNFWWTFLACVFTLDWYRLWYVQTLQLYRVCSPEWNIFMCCFRLLFWIDLLHSLQLLFSLFWWTFLTCEDKLHFVVAWYSHISHW